MEEKNKKSRKRNLLSSVKRSRKISTKATIGQAPGTAIYVGLKTEADLSIEIIDFTKEDIHEEKFHEIENSFKYLDTSSVSWVNINGLRHTEEIRKIGAHCELHPLIIEDIVNTNQRPKVDEYDNYFYVVLKMLYFDKQEELIVEHISFVLGKNYVISFQEADGDVFDALRDRIRKGKGRVRQLGPDYLLYALMDAVVDHYFGLAEILSGKIELMEDQLFESSTPENITIKIQNLKREVLKIKRAVLPLREVVNRLEKSEHKLISERTNLYLRDLYDHIIQVSESVEIYRDMIWSLMDIYMSVISNRMNQVMKVLTIIATIFIPLTFLAGIYGMNFKYMPELDLRYSYFVLLGVMVVLFLGMLYYFKHKDWL